MASELHVGAKGGDEVIDGAEDVTVEDILAEVRQAVTDSGNFMTRCVSAFEIRNCIWAGQSADGRKHEEQIGEKPFPWEGASDTKIRLADEVVNDGVRVLRASVKRSLLQAAPVDANDTEKAAAVTKYLKVLFQSRMRDNLRQEIPLLANWQETYGLAALAVTWETEQRVQKRTVPLTELQEIAAQLEQLAVQAMEQGDQAGAEAIAEKVKETERRLAALFDPAQDDETAEWLRGIYVGLTKRQAKRALEKLRTEGACVVPEYVTVRSQPEWTACRPMYDLIFPANTTDLRKAPWVAWRETVTRVELQARQVKEDYEPAVIEKMLEQHGKTVLDENRIDMGKDVTIENMKDRVEILRVYRMVVDKDGYTKIQVTHLNPFVEEAAVQYDLDYDHGENPFVHFCRDRRERVLLVHKGVPELAETAQSEIKIQRDFRADRLSITQLPPLKVPLSRINDNIELGPNKRLPERRPGELDFLKMPQIEPDTVGLEKQIRLDTDNYFGRAAEGVSPTRQQLYAQSATDDFLGGLQDAAKQTIRLVLQKAPEDFQRVTGMAAKELENFDFDIILDFNAADLNMEFVLSKLEAINKGVLPIDTGNVIQRNVVAEWAMRSIDPTLADRAVLPQEAAEAQEIEDEQKNFALIMAGTEPPMREGGQNFALRLRVLQQILQANTELPRRLANQPDGQAMLEKRMEHLQFQVQQQQNAQIGKLGAMPALG